MARTKAKRTRGVVIIHNPATPLELTNGGKIKVKTNPSRRRARAGGSRRRTTRRRKNPATALAVRSNNPPARRRNGARRRRNPSRIFNPSLRSLGATGKFAVLGAFGALAVNALANLNPMQRNLSPWLAVGVKGGLAWFVGIGGTRLFGAANGEALRAGAIIMTAVDAISLLTPLVSQQIAAVVVKNGQPTVATTPAAAAPLSGYQATAENQMAGLVSYNPEVMGYAGDNQMAGLVSVPENSPIYDAGGVY